jgi:hypothetical protein
MSDPLRMLMAGAQRPQCAHRADDAHLAISLMKASPSVIEKPIYTCVFLSIL